MSWTHAWLSELFWKDWLHSFTEDRNLGDGHAFRLGAGKSLSGTKDVAQGDVSVSAVFQHRPQQLDSDSISVSRLGREVFLVGWLYGAVVTAHLLVTVVKRRTVNPNTSHCTGHWGYGTLRQREWTLTWLTLPRYMCVLYRSVIPSDKHGWHIVPRMPAMSPRFPGSPKCLNLFGLCHTLLGRKMSCCHLCSAETIYK